MSSKEVCYIMTKVSIHQLDSTVLNNYAPNNNASKYMYQKLAKLKGETDKSPNTVGYVHTPLLQLIELADRKQSIFLKYLTNHSKSAWYLKVSFYIMF